MYVIDTERDESASNGDAALVGQGVVFVSRGQAYYNRQDCCLLASQWLDGDRTALALLRDITLIYRTSLCNRFSGHDYALINWRRGKFAGN